MDETPRGEPAAETPPDPATQSRLLDELGRLVHAVRHLFGAQWRLFLAELSLARGAVSLLLALGLVATVAGVGLGLTVLALIGVALARWFHSWPWALVVLVLLQGAVLAGAVVLFRRALRWLSLPATRGEFGAMMRSAAAKAREADAAASDPARTPPP
ncbi:MAG TPA: ABC transporter ATP-binding protein [Dyella sp.]|nr:ABC transporter ATP-binding protein [Dyella sp.]